MRLMNKNCCLCGSGENLTGEHKIKVSAIRSEFGREPMSIGRVGDQDGLRSAQGPKSKEFHFATPVCGTCNNERTQPADLEFDHFHRETRALLAAGKDPSEVFMLERYSVGSLEYFNVFRYFAKLMCCQIGDGGGGRMSGLSDFAVGSSNRNPIHLAIDKDWTYDQISKELGDHSYAAHGGLVIYGKASGTPTCFHSTLTIGPLRYTYYARMNIIGRIILKMTQPDFYQKCSDSVRETVNNPMSQTERLQLGLYAGDE